ncbi:uncharacterized protein [Haliotis cracherodii]|uniref:uncharacterized protein n=1 Tax=Haliotis cracherodii TaxID=6455 RepID=UPI0039EBBA43
MLRVKIHNAIFDGGPTGRGQYRQYVSNALDKAYEAVIDGMAIRRASEKFCVPFSTLHDWISGKVSVDCVTTGREPLLSLEEEKLLVDHIDVMANFGYGYSRAEVTAIATDLAIHLGKRSKDDPPLSMQWFYGFVKRWPDLRVKKPRSLDLQRAKATSEETITHYFDELGSILKKYRLEDSPQRIYNVDEKGLVENHVPPSIVSSQQVPTAVVAPRSSTTTVIGCGNASGNAIPPFFVFKGQRMREELLSGCTPGLTGTVTETGWSNTEVFQHYLQSHFKKHAVAASEEFPLLVLYDGHKCHISIPLITWARENNIVLFVLPAHTSHVLQPMGVGCFGPFSKVYNNLRHKSMRENASSSIDKHLICELACKAYNLSLTTSNLQSSFRKCGIYPFDKSTTTKINFAPFTVFKQASKSNGENDDGDQTSSLTDVTTFFQDKEDVLSKKAVPTKKRNVLSAVVGGKPITESSILDKIVSHQAKAYVPKRKSQPPKTSKPISKKKKCTQASPRPSTSKAANNSPVSINDSDLLDWSSDSDREADNEVCCVCSKREPQAIGNCYSELYTSWAQCTHPTCQHWVHLRYCTSVRVVRRNSEFWCPCHNEKEE